MSIGNINFANNQFINYQTWDQFQEFLTSYDKTVITSNAKSYGLAKYEGNFKVVQGSLQNSIKLETNSIAIDKDANIITLAPFDNLAIPNTNFEYHVLVSFEKSSIEQGTVSIDSNGTLTGVGTEFTKHLQDNSNGLASVIKFSNAVSNIQEYHVAHVVSDTLAYLNGNFVVEGNLNYKIVGTFAPDYVPQNSELYPYEYNSCDLELIQVTGGDFTIPDYKFLIANISVDNGNFIIKDQRTAFFENNESNIPLNISDNILIGIESARWNSEFSVNDKNIVSLAWCFRVLANDWSINSGIRQISITNGEGGLFKTINHFSNGNFDGWRVYKNTGEYDIIKTSSISGNAILLNMDKLVNYDITKGLLITPNCEGIEILISSDSANPYKQLDKIIYCDINTDLLNIELDVPNELIYKYNFKYRYKTLNQYSEIKAFPSATIAGINGNGYYAETSFNLDGTLKNVIDRTRKTYTYDSSLGYIELILNENSYYNTINKLNTNDKFGVEHRTLSNVTPVVTFNVGINYQTQVVEGNTTLATNHYFNLPSSGSKNGNMFRFYFQNDITFGGFNFYVTQDYVNSGNPGVILFQINNYYNARSIDGNLILECRFDGVNWIAKEIVAMTEDIYNAVNNNFLAKSSNLSDLQSDSTARTNLDVYSKSETDSNISTLESNLIDGANTYFDSLGKIQSVLQDNENIISDLNTEIATKATKSAYYDSGVPATPTTERPLVRNIADGKVASETRGTAFNKNFGTVAGTVAEGDHVHANYAVHHANGNTWVANAVEANNCVRYSTTVDISGNSDIQITLKKEGGIIVGEIQLFNLTAYFGQTFTVAIPDGFELDTVTNFHVHYLNEPQTVMPNFLSVPLAKLRIDSGGSGNFVVTIFNTDQTDIISWYPFTYMTYLT